MSLELETLDQLLAGDLPLQVVRKLFPDDAAFSIGVHALLRNGDVQLFANGVEVPRWRWRELFDEGRVTQEMPQLTLAATDQGARRVS